MKYIFPYNNRHYLYKITNTLNSKIYIGRSKVPSYRYRRHIQESKNIEKSKRTQKIHFAINELGLDNFIFEVFEECENYFLACEREIFWINHYHSDEDDFGYNDKVGLTGVPIWNELVFL